MEINDSTSIDESMREALLEWVRQFSSGSVSWHDLTDGFILNDIMSKITQDNALKQLRESFLKQTINKEAIILEEWIHLIDTLFSFYQDSLQYLVFINPPDVQVICNNPNSDEALKEVELAVLMILGCAVLCSHKKEFVEQIRSLDVSHHPAIVRCIKEITERPDDNFLHISQISPDKFALISKNLNKQNFAKRMVQMRQEILAQVNDKGGGDDDDDDEVESLENVKRNFNDLIEVQECKIKELKSLLDDRTEKLEDVQKDLEKSREKMTFLEEQNILLSREASTVNAYISELEAANEKASKLSQLERKHSKLQKKLADLEFWKQQAGHMAEENEKMCRLNEQLENEVDGLKKKCNELKFCEAEVARLEKEVEENAKARKNDVDLIRELTYQKEQLEIQNNKLLKLIDSNKPLTKEYHQVNQQKWLDQGHDDDDDDDDETKKETTKLDESFATLYELGTTPGSARQSLTIETARLIDIDGTLMESCTQTEDAGRENDDDDNDDDGVKRRKRSWKVSKEEMELSDTVDNLSVEIKRLKDFVKLKDASILLMNLKVTEKSRECERLLAEVEECKKSHQIQIHQLKAQSSNYATGTEALKSRLASSQTKIDSLKQDRERIRLELDSFSERITSLIIENNRLVAQHEASIAMCSRVEDENVKLLDQLRETLGQNQELLSLILTSKDHRAEEQKSYIEQLSELKYNKEKLEEKIYEFLRKKEKKSLGFGTLVRKMKNKPTKSEQFLMSLESPRKMPETSSDQDSKDSESKNKYLEKKRDNYSPPSHASTSCLLPPQKHSRNMAPKLSFSQTARTNMADNKKLFRSEMNVTWPDDDGGGGKHSEHETKDLSVDDKMITNFQSNDLQNSAHENIGGIDENVHAGINENENQIQQISLQKCEPTEATTCSNNESNQPNETDQSNQMSQYDEQINKDNEENEKIFIVKSEKSMEAINDSDLKGEFDETKDENSPETTFITRFKTSRDLTGSTDGGEQSPSNNDDIANTSKADAKQNAEDEIFVKGSRSTSVPHARYDSGIEDVGEINRRSNQRIGKRFRTLSELNIRFNEMKTPATKPSIFKTSLKSAFSAAGRKIVREMSHLKGIVSWKVSPGINLVQDTDSKNLAPMANMPCGNVEESKDQCGSSEISYCKAQSDVKEIDRSTPHSDINKTYSNVPHSSKLTFENLAERRPPKTTGETECELDSKLESTDGIQKDQMKASALARPKRKQQAPNLPEEQLSSSSSSSNSSSLSLSKKKLETKKLSTSSSSSLSSSPILPYKESNVCI